MFPGLRYTSGGRNDHLNPGGFNLRELLDANYERSSGNIFVVGRPNFPEPGLNAAYDFVPVGLARRAVRRDTPITASSWWCESSIAWTSVAEVFGAKRDASVGTDTRRDLAWGGSNRPGGGRRENGDQVRDTVTGSLALPPSEKYGPEWWESTLRIIVYDAAAGTAAYGLERALNVPEDERGAAEKLLMTRAAFFLEAVFQESDERCENVARFR